MIYRIFGYAIAGSLLGILAGVFGWVVYALVALIGAPFLIIPAFVGAVIGALLGTEES